MGKSFVMLVALEPVQHIDTKGGRQIAVFGSVVVYFGQKSCKAHFAFFRDSPQFVPEGILERDAGAMTVEGSGMLADQNIWLSKLIQDVASRIDVSQISF